MQLVAVVNSFVFDVCRCSKVKKYWENYLSWLVFFQIGNHIMGIILIVIADYILLSSELIITIMNIILITITTVYIRPLVATF